ncbi:MAG: hypothetical protein AAFY71_12055 [Bacteroidota bacterium]
MEAFVQALLPVHVILGLSCLISGPTAAIARKGGKLHSISGRVFAISMIVTTILALIVTCIPGHYNPILFTIGIFGFYLVVSGWRSIKLKKLGRGDHAKWYDWALMLGVGLFGLVMIGYGVYLVTKSHMFALVLFLFGYFCLSLAKGDYQRFTKMPEDRLWWMFDHLNKMNGGLITAFTAFLVNNNSFMPMVLGWLLPSVIGAALGTMWTRKYKRKLGRI